MTRFEATYNWLKPIFERIIEVQKHGGLIFDEDNEILKQLAAARSTSRPQKVKEWFKKTIAELKNRRGL